MTASLIIIIFMILLVGTAIGVVCATNVREGDTWIYRFDLIIEKDVLMHLYETGAREYPPRVYTGDIVFEHFPKSILFPYRYRDMRKLRIPSIYILRWSPAYREVKKIYNYCRTHQKIYPNDPSHS